MDIIYLKAILIGIVEGITEFMPISSTAHIMFFSDLIGFAHPAQKLFETVIQLGSIFAVCLVFKEKILRTTFTLHKKESRYFVLTLLAAFIPVVIFGLLFHSAIKTALSSPFVISISLIVGGCILILVEKLKIKPVHTDSEKMPMKAAFIVGLFQCIALIPGVSRSGSTIVGALLMRADRKTAVEFSFLVAIPTLFAASAYDIYKNAELINNENMALITVGMLSAFFTSLITVKFLLNFIIKRGLFLFGIYRIVIGIFALLATLYGANFGAV